MNERYQVVDNVDAIGPLSGYELVDTAQIPPCTFAVGLREEFAVRIADQLNAQHEALKIAQALIQGAGSSALWMDGVMRRSP